MIVKFERSKYGTTYKATDFLGNVYYAKHPSEHWLRALGEPVAEVIIWQTSMGNQVEGRVLEALRTAHEMHIRGDGDAWHREYSEQFKDNDDEDAYRNLLTL